MNLKILKQIWFMSKLSIYGLILQMILYNCLIAKESEAQSKSIKDIYVEVDLQNSELSDVFSQIESQTEFSFIFSKDIVNAQQKLNQNYKGKISLALLLKDISLETFYGFKRVNDNILVKRRSNDHTPMVVENEITTIQQFKVSGKVTSSKSEPLPGVSILIQGTSSGTTTDMNGDYLLNANQGDILLFSFIGYKPQEIEVGNQSIINISMTEDLEQLEEVVVVGYGAQSRVNVTGAVSKVDVEVIEDTPNTNITQALRGRVAGVQFQDSGRPGQGGEILVRGRASITASNAPLIVLDGVFFNGSLADINPNDVESMEVLKDASATAIYGARAANGVILVTTKRGTSEKPTINLNTSFGVSTWANRLNLLTPERYIDKTLGWIEAGGQTANPSDIESFLSPIEAENFRNNRTIDPYDEISQNGYIQNYNLSVSGRSESTNYFISGSYTDEKGMIFGDVAQRLALRANVQTSLNSWLNIGFNAQYSHRDLSGEEADMGLAYYTSPYGSLFDAQNTPVPFPSNETLAFNPLFNAINNQDEEKYNNLFANFYATIDFPFLEGLSYRINASPNLRWANRNIFVPNFSNDDYQQLASASKTVTQNFDWVIENILKYSRTINDIHDVDVTLLYGRNQFNTDRTRAAADFFFSNQTSWDNLGLGEVPTVASGRTQLDQLSMMARVNYRLMDKYLLTLTARRDGSSVFGAQNKWGTFPSVALAWIASNEAFLENSKFIDFLKLRISHGSIGNQGLNPYSSLNRLGTTQYVFGPGSATFIGLRPSQMANANLGWETSVTTNLAVDFGILNDRINGTVEVYRSNVDDLLLNRAIPASNGFQNVLQNIGSTRNQGIELSINTINMQKADFTWTSNLMFTSNLNEITSLYGVDADGDGVEDNDIANAWFIGEPVLVEFGLESDGIWQEGDDIPSPFEPGDAKFKDINGNGEFEGDNDRTVVGQREPKFIWGLGNTLDYKNFSFSFFVTGQHGFIREFRQLDPSLGGSNFPGRAVNMLDEGDGWWTPENRSNSRPRLNYNNALGQQFYADRDFVRLQDVSLSYTFNDAVLDKLKLSNLKVFLSGRNLVTLTDWPGWDPENGDNNFNAFPAARTYMAGLNLSF